MFRFQLSCFLLLGLLVATKGMQLPLPSRSMLQSSSMRSLINTPINFENTKDEEKTMKSNEKDSHITSFLFLNGDENPVITIQNLLKKVLTIFRNGFTDFYHNYQRVSKLKKLLKLNNNNRSILSYSDYKLLELYEQDFQKAIRTIIFIPFAFEFFIYTSVLLPILTMNNNLWAFINQFPSTFDTPEDRYKREHLLYLRRLSSLYTIGLIQYKEISENQYYPAQQNMVKRIKENIHLIEDALIQYLQQANLIKAINTLQPFYSTTNNNNNGNKGNNGANSAKTEIRRRKIDLNTSGLSPAVVKECCRAIGRDGVPNLPIINNLNRKELVTFTENLKNSDDFLYQHSLSDLNESELKSACLER